MILTIHYLFCLKQWCIDSTFLAGYFVFIIRENVSSPKLILVNKQQYIFLVRYMVFWVYVFWIYDLTDKIMV